MAYNMGLRPFRFWCQQVLPLVYDDSLSYMELLSKVIYRLNELQKKTQEGFDDLSDDIEEIRAQIQEILENMPTDFSEAVEKLKEAIQAEIDKIDGKLQQQFDELETQLKDEIAQQGDDTDAKLAAMKTELENTIEHNNQTQNLKIDLIKTQLETANNQFQESITKQITELESYMNQYFDNLNLADEVDKALDAMAADGRLNNLLQPLVFAALTPQFVDSVSKMIDVNKVYVLTTNNHIYQYRNGTWTDTGLTYGYAANTMEGFGEDFLSNSQVSAQTYKNLNELESNRIYYYTGMTGLLNAPKANFAGQVMTMATDVSSPYQTQIAIEAGTNQMFIRQQNVSGFTEWTGSVTPETMPKEVFQLRTASGTALSALTLNGFYLLPSGTTYSDLPAGLPSGDKLLLSFTSTSPSKKYQIIFVPQNKQVPYIRYSGTNNSWNEWVALGKDTTAIENAIADLQTLTATHTTEIADIKTKNTQQDTAISNAATAAANAATAASNAAAKAESAQTAANNVNDIMYQMQLALGNAFVGFDGDVESGMGAGYLNSFSWDYIGINRSYTITSRSTDAANTDPLPGSSPHTGLLLSFGPYAVPPLFPETVTNSSTATVLYFHIPDQTLWVVQREYANGAWGAKPTLSDWKQVGGSDFTLPDGVLRNYGQNITGTQTLKSLTPNRIYYMSSVTTPDGPVTGTMTGFLIIFNSTAGLTRGVGVYLIKLENTTYIGYNNAASGNLKWEEIVNTENPNLWRTRGIVTTGSLNRYIKSKGGVVIDPSTVTNIPSLLDNRNYIFLIPSETTAVTGIALAYQNSKWFGLWAGATDTDIPTCKQIYPAVGSLQSSTWAGTNLNSLTEQGSYRLSASTVTNATNTPSGAINNGGAQVEVFASDTYLVQLWVQNGFCAIRMRDSTTFGSWTTLSGGGNTALDSDAVVQSPAKNYVSVAPGSIRNIPRNKFYSTTNNNGFTDTESVLTGASVFGRIGPVDATPGEYQIPSMGLGISRYMDALIAYYSGNGTNVRVGELAVASADEWKDFLRLELTKKVNAKISLISDPDTRGSFMEFWQNCTIEDGPLSNATYNGWRIVIQPPFSNDMLEVITQIVYIRRSSTQAIFAIQNTWQNHTWFKVDLLA